ncbi:MAG: lipopolysaccharide heptosyltransferase I [Rhodoferax sp.]
MRILIVKLSSLGDVVHAMAAVQDIRAAFPDARIDWVVEDAFAALVQRCQGVHRTIPCALRRWRKHPFAAATRQAWAAFKAELQREAYDWVIDLQGLSKSALVAWLARLAPGGQRVALGNQTEGSGWEAPTRWVAHVAPVLPTHVHAVQRARLLCAQALGYALRDEEHFGLLARVDTADDAINFVVIQPGTVALVHGTSRADKQWPGPLWVALGQALDAVGWNVVLVHGTAQEQATSQALAAQIPGAQVWPLLDLAQLTDALARCAGVIGVDSGVSHIAVALDLPHVQLYNFDTAWRTGPGRSARQRSVYGHPHPVAQDVWQAWTAVAPVLAAGEGA